MESGRVHKNINASDPRNRAGAATLELVLSMPILIAIVVGLVWLGTSAVAQTEVTVEARHQTWSKRSEPAGTALLFLKDDVVNDTATTTVDVSPIFDDAAPPESSHDIMVGSWSHETLPLDSAPNWKQYAIAAANAKTGAAQVGYSDARNNLTQFRSQASSLWNSLGAGLIRQLTGLGDSVRSALDGGKNSGANESRERTKINQKLAAKRAELSAARRALRELDDDASESLRDVMKNKIERLRAEIDDLEADRRALSK